MLLRFTTVLIALTVALSSTSTGQPPAAAIDFIDTSIENGSPVVVRGRRQRRPNQSDLRPRALVTEPRRRPYPLRAARAPGASLTLEFRNLDNVWNGQPGSVAGELKTVAISEDGKAWRTVPTDSLPGNRVQLRVTLTGPRLHVARMEPYRLSDLSRLLDTIRAHRLVRVEPIGQTVAGRAARDRSHRQSGRAVSRLRPRPRASVGGRQQLGRARAHRAPADRR